MHEKLTAKEVKMLELAATGHPNKEIARHLGLREHTIRNYMLVTYEKAGVRGRLRTVLYFLRRGEINPPMPTHDHRDRP